jgi:hypothetical protein
MKKAIISLIGVVVLILTVLPGLSPSPASAADTGVEYPGTVSETSASSPYDDNSWTSEGNVGADDATYASVTADSFDSGDYSYVLRATDFGFSIPADRTIQGIKVEIERYCGAGSARDALVQLTKNGSARVGNSKADTSNNWSGSVGVATYGGETDLWGATWTRDEINASTFGVHLAARAYSDNTDIYVDFIRITVYYTPPVPNPALNATCGLDVVLVIDSSGSISASEYSQMQAALVAFVNALADTPTQFALVEFASYAVDRLPGWTANNTTIINEINEAREQPGGQYTNWEDALRVARGLFPNRDDNPDLIIFASDGNPSATGNSSDYDEDVAESVALAAAVTEANAAKSAGIRILTIGIGGGTGEYEAYDRDNLIAISSEDALVETDFEDFADALAELATQLCGGTITVHKIIDCDGDIASQGDQTDGGNWTFTADVISPGSSTPPSGDTDSNGLINFDIGFGGQPTATRAQAGDDPGGRRLRLQPDDAGKRRAYRRDLPGPSRDFRRAAQAAPWTNFQYRGRRGPRRVSERSRSGALRN